MDGPYELASELVGALPVVNHFSELLGLDELLERYVPANDSRLALAPAKALGVVVANLLISHQPLYQLGEWAAPYRPDMLGLEPDEVCLLNDDRVGRALALLFDADRASLLTEVVLRAVRRFRIDCSELHDDSTTVTFSGATRASKATVRGGKATAAAKRGFNKDHRPDLRQLLLVLTVSSDGAVPVAYRAADGNTEDSSTHTETWDGLVSLLGRKDFLYVADCKLATRDVMLHIGGEGGRFVSVLPRTRKEDAWFRDWVTRNRPSWQEATKVPARRKNDPPDVLSTFESPLPSAEGYRVIWVHSSAKQENDALSRARRIERATAALEDLAGRLAGPKCRIKTRVAAEEEAKAALEEHDAARYFEIWVLEEVEKTYVAEHRGTPGPETRFRQSTKPRFRLTWNARHHVVKAEAASDGCWPLVTNDTEMTPAEVLSAYKYQPNLERRNHVLKGPQAVAPVFLRNPARIEGLLCCHFLALLIGALIERQIRDAMVRSKTKAIPLYPEDRDCAAPSAERVLEIFAPVTRHHLVRNGRLVQTFEPTLTELQEEVLRLLGIHTAYYGG
ncbi:MAG: IS1634 family transposase [Acidimicrobiales bacterium]